MISYIVIYLFLGLVAVASLGGCASRSNIQRDCKPIGDGGFFECEKYPWWKKNCERFE